jgi:hypothetical protein
VKMHQKELYQWGLMVGTQSTPEKGHGNYSDVEHLEDAHSLRSPL